MAKNSSTYLWQGKDYNGKIIEGQESAQDADSLRVALRQRNIKLLHTDIAPHRLQHAIKKTTLGTLLATKHVSQQQLKSSDVSHLLQQLTLLLRAGVPILQCFDILNQGQNKSAVKPLLSEIKRDLEGGLSLSDSLRNQGRCFDPILCNMIAVGEYSGSLNKMLENIVHHRKKIEALQRNLQRALIYPCTIIIISLLVILILFISVVPQFEKLFHDFGAELPSYTQLLIQISHGIKDNGMIFISMSLILIFITRYSYRRHPVMQRYLDRTALHIPIFGKAYHCSLLARFNCTLSTLVSAGIPLLDCLNKMSSIMPNLIFKEACISIMNDVHAGASLSTSFRKFHYFPNLMQDMIRTGEESGNLSMILNNLSEVYNEELEQWVAAMNSLLEPLIISLLGLIVGSIILAMYLPIFKLSSII